MSTIISGTNGVTFPDSTSMQTGQQACKAWVNFNGTGTVAIRGSYNVSSITDNGTGYYTVNLTTAVVDTNGALLAGKANQVTNAGNATGVAWQSTVAFDIVNYEGGLIVDGAFLYFAVFS